MSTATAIELLAETVEKLAEACVPVIGRKAANEIKETTHRIQYEVYETELEQS